MAGGIITLNPSRGTSTRLLIPDPPDRDGGVGGWNASDRALRRPAKWYGSQPDDTYSISGILDIDALVGPAIEQRMLNLRKMGLPSGDKDPPTIKLYGDVWTHDRTITWVMTNISFGARQFNPDGTLRQQHVTVSLERFNPLDEIEAIKVRSTRSRGRRRRHTVKSRAGETLRSVAVRELGSAARWKDLRRWNKKLRKTDPDQRLRAGTHVTIR